MAMVARLDVGPRFIATDEKPSSKIVKQRADCSTGWVLIGGRNRSWALSLVQFKFVLQLGILHIQSGLDENTDAWRIPSRNGELEKCLPDRCLEPSLHFADCLRRIFFAST
jgi:hypothetical protein